MEKKHLIMSGKSFGAGLIAGIIFQLLNFPAPAPPNFEAFLGVFGVWLGSALVLKFSRRDS